MTEDEHVHRAIAVPFAILLTAGLLVWLRPHQPIWWFCAALAVSAWTCALQPMVEDVAKASAAWCTGGLQYLRNLLVGFRQAGQSWLDRQFWNKFRRAV